MCMCSGSEILHRPGKFRGCRITAITARIVHVTDQWDSLLPLLTVSRLDWKAHGAAMNTRAMKAHVRLHLSSGQAADQVQQSSKSLKYHAAGAFASSFLCLSAAAGMLITETTLGRRSGAEPREHTMRSPRHEVEAALPRRAPDATVAHGAPVDVAIEVKCLIKLQQQNQCAGEKQLVIRTDECLCRRNVSACCTAFQHASGTALLPTLNMRCNAHLQS